MFRITSVLFIFACLIVSGCTSGYNGSGIGDESSYDENIKIEGEAMLFDVKLKRDGKPTSIRLELYLTDTITAFSGRGYLGKGALKGMLSPDSVLVYFPRSNEFLYEPVYELLNFDECDNKLEDINFIDIITSLPNDSMVGGTIDISSNNEDSDKPKFTLYNPECDWQIDLEYDQRETGWRLRSFVVDDG